MFSVEVQVVSSRVPAGQKFQVVEGVVALAGGSRICEILIDGDKKVENGKRYTVEFNVVVDREKHLSMRVSNVIGTK